MKTVAVLALAALMGGATAYAQQAGEAHEKAEAADAAKGSPVLAGALKGVTVTLTAAMQVSESQGQPISAKFELEDGKLQLSVYTMKQNSFFEVIVDHKTGKIAKTEPITEGDDLTAARRQASAMAKTKRTLREIVAKVEKANPGYRVVSVVPEMEGPVSKADVGLLRGVETKQVEEPL